MVDFTVEILGAQLAQAGALTDRELGQLTTRKKLTDEDIEGFKNGTANDRIYIGRGSGRTGLGRSRWCNPFQIGVHGTREGVLNLFRDYAEETFDKKEYRELQGRTLVCHCEPDQGCHGDFLAQMANGLDPRPEDEDMTNDHDGLEDGLPIRIGDRTGTDGCDGHPQGESGCDMHLREDDPLDPNVWRGWLGRGSRGLPQP